MGELQDIVQKHDIKSANGFHAAMKAVARVSEGELWFTITAHDPVIQSTVWKDMHALAKAELDRRAFNAQKSLARTAGYFGLAGVIVGALLQALANWVLHDTADALSEAETVTIEEADP